MTPLRGRVVVRPHEPDRIGSIYLPQQAHDNERQRQRSQGHNARSSHQGTVLAKGPPAMALDGEHEIAHGFEIGDVVTFVYVANEAERKHEWTDGKPCVWLAQEEVIAVHEKESGPCVTDAE